MPSNSLDLVGTLFDVVGTDRVTLVPQGVLSDDAGGMYPSDVIYSDLDIPQLERLPPTQPHRAVDLMLVEADKQGTCIVTILSQKLINYR